MRTVGEVLDSVMESVGLSWSCFRESIYISSPEINELSNTVRVYPLQRMSLTRDEQLKLVELIKEVVTPDEWDFAGGPGAIELLPGMNCLIVSNWVRYEGLSSSSLPHDGISRLLKGLHKVDCKGQQSYECRESNVFTRGRRRRRPLAGASRLPFFQ